MGNPPEWWLTVSGLYFVLASIVMIVTLALLATLIRLTMDLISAVKTMNNRVQSLTDRVEAIAETVQDVTNDVGSRTKGIVKVVDDHALAAFDLVEKYAPLLVGAAIVLKLGSLFGSRRRS